MSLDKNHYEFQIDDIPREVVEYQTQRGIEKIRENQQSSGAFPASPSFAMYGYNWLRDASFVDEALRLYGFIGAVERNYDFASNVINVRRDAILAGERLPACFTYDGADGHSNDGWASFQLDGYGLFLASLATHAKRGRPIDRYQKAIGLTQHYLTEHWQEPCFDWWEEREGNHAATLACMFAGLEAFDNPVANDIKAAIDLDKEPTDASLLIVGCLDAVSEAEFAPTLERIETELVDADGGVHRHKDDDYYGGGAWPVTTALLGVYYNKIGRVYDARAKFRWVMDQMDDNGNIPEQTTNHSHLLLPDKYQEWVDRWGQPANPLLWSHAMHLILADELDLHAKL